MKHLTKLQDKIALGAVIVGFVGLMGFAGYSYTSGQASLNETTAANSGVVSTVMTSTANADTDGSATDNSTNSTTDNTVKDNTVSDNTTKTNTDSDSAGSTVTTVSYSGGVIDTSELFTERDLTQTADLSEAVTYTVTDGQDITITEAGVYVITGNAEEVSIIVDADDEAKVQIVLDGANITNTDAPVIYVKNADKVFVTTSSDSSLSVTGSFTADGDTNTDGVIFSKDDLVLNGTATLTIVSTDNGIVGKDDLKITGGTYVVTAASKAFEANDSILVADGTFEISTGTDGFHAENDDDDSLGYIVILDGNFNINAGDDAIHATTVIQIDGGTINIQAAEGLEGTYIQQNGGDVTINASDDGVNAAQKSTVYTPTFEMNDGTLTVSMGQGDTDAIDSNGNIIVNGGTINVTGSSTFDYDGNAQFNGGTIIVNGQEVSSIPNSMMGGGMMGGMGGAQGGMMGPGGRR